MGSGRATDAGGAISARRAASPSSASAVADPDPAVEASPAADSKEGCTAASSDLTGSERAAGVSGGVPERRGTSNGSNVIPRRARSAGDAGPSSISREMEDPRSTSGGSGFGSPPCAGAGFAAPPFSAADASDAAVGDAAAIV